MVSGSSDSEDTIDRLKRRLARERKKREQVELFAEQKTRQLYLEKEIVELMSRVVNATARSELLTEACQSVATILLDFTKVDAVHLIEVQDGEVRIPVLKVSGGVALESINFELPEWQDIFYDSKNTLKYTFDSDDEPAKLFHWVYRVSESPAYFFALSFVSRQKYFQFNEKILSHCGQQLKQVIGRQRSAELIHNISHYDQLTQLCTKQVFQSRLSQIIHRQKKKNVKVAVLCLDIANMGLINTEYSMEVGNQLIKYVASEIASLLRMQDAITRHAGDGFLLFLMSDSVSEAIEGVVKRVNQHFDKDINWIGEAFRVKFHIGYAKEDANNATAEALIQHAEIAVKHAKKAMVPVEFQPAMLDKAKQVMRLDQELIYALEKNEFQLYYQPIVDLKTRKIVKAEALIRWRKNGRLIPPVEFIPHLEEGELILPVGRWVIEQALADFKVWSRMKTDIRQVGVNLSVRQFDDDSLDKWISSLLSKYALSSDCLVLEVTESLSLDPTEQMEQFIARFKALGIDIALDDFGTGYSSLSYLHRYPFSYLKIDRSFIVNLDSGCKSINLLQSIIALSASLEMASIAEGIETEGVARLLGHMGVHYGQGYYFSRPVPADEFAKLLTKSED